jgi:N-acetylneuraminic acid mutarotase
LWLFSNYFKQLETNEWKKIEISKGPSGRFHHKAFFHEKKMFIFGGIESGNNFLNECWFIDLELFQWTQIKPTSTFIPQPRYGSQLFIHSNKLYIYGGCNSKHDFSEMLVMDLNSLEWSIDNLINIKDTSGTCYTGLILYNSVLYFYGGNIKEFESEKEFLNESQNLLERNYQLDYNI